MKKVFLSSTSKDLSRYRDTVYKAIEGLDGFHCIRMEDFGARNVSPKELCSQKISECDLVIYLVGLCYGSNAPGLDESYTILEYRAARAAQIPQLIFMSTDEIYRGYIRESDELWDKQQKFRVEINNDDRSTREIFTEPDDLARKVVSAIRNWEQKRKNDLITQSDYFDQRAPGTAVQQFDHLPCPHTSLSDLDIEKINEFLAKESVKRQDDFKLGVPLQTQLMHLKLLRESRPTFAALLCFGQQPQDILTGAWTRCIYWRGNTRNEGYLDDKDCLGDLIAQFESCLNFLSRRLRFSRIIGGNESEEECEIPMVALREAIANALIHREYARSNNTEYRTECVQVEVFTTRVEIKSPGPPLIEVNALPTQEATHPRNPLIARIFYLYRHVERAGSGIQRMREAMEKVGLPPPRFEMSGDGQTLKVTLIRPQQVSDEILESSEFSLLLKVGIEAIAKNKKVDIEQVIADVGNTIDMKNLPFMQMLHQGRVPSPNHIAAIARICVQEGSRDQTWLRSFLRAAHYPDIETMVIELSSFFNIEGSRFAVVVGVNNSERSDYRAAGKYAERDAYDMAYLLRQQACNFMVLNPFLTGKEATTANVKETIIKLVEKGTNQDLLLFYFSGHAQPMRTKDGLEEIYLVTHDFSERDIAIDPTIHLSLRWLKKILWDQSGAGSVLLILDCCYGGRIADNTVDSNPIDLYSLLKDYFVNSAVNEQGDRLRVILSTTSYDATTDELDDHGFMTKYLLRALSGEAIQVVDDEGKVDIHSLHRYLQENMQKQPPFLGGQLPRPCILASYPDLSKHFQEAEATENIKTQLSELRKIITDPNFFHNLSGVSYKEPFDYTICHSASFTDLKMKSIEEFLQRERVQMQQDFREGTSYVDQLEQFGFIRQSYPTYGALLCFAKSPTKWLPGAYTRCIYWHGNDRLNGWLEDRLFQGSLLEQFESSIEFLRGNLRLNRVINGEGSTEQWEIPFVALREALANALIHREYVNRMDFVRVEVFDDRIEISSPGDLPIPLTLEQLNVSNLSHPRNPQIARFFYLSGYAEHVGSGIARMQHLLKEAELPLPEFQVSPQQVFKVVLRRMQH